MGNILLKHNLAAQCILVQNIYFQLKNIGIFKMKKGIKQCLFDTICRVMVNKANDVGI